MSSGVRKETCMGMRIQDPVVSQVSAPKAIFPGNFNFTSAPVLMAPRTDCITVLIGVSHPSTCWIEYGTSPELGQRASGAVGGLLPFRDTIHKIRLRGLKPGTSYYYRVCASPVIYKSAYHIFRGPVVSSPLYTFRTFSEEAETCDFQMIHDTHEVTDTVHALANLLARDPGDFILFNGDIVTDIYDESQFFRGAIDFHGHAYAAGTPVIISRGNHDIRGPLARAYSRYIDVPGENPYYSFRHGPVGFIVLDAGEDKEDSHPEYGGMNDFASYREEQYQWLLKEIERPSFASAPWRIVIIHIPLRWKDQPELNGWWWDGVSRWHKALAAAGVTAVLSGHTHRTAILEPTADQPFYQFVGGGSEPDIATLTRVYATKKTLSVRIQNLNGQIIVEKNITEPPATHPFSWGLS